MIKRYFQPTKSKTSHSADFSKTGNPEESANNSSPAICLEEKEGNISQHAVLESGPEAKRRKTSLSHSADFSKTGNPEESANNSSPAICLEEKKGNIRNHTTNLYHISFPDYDRDLLCQSTGQETIFDMVIREFKSSGVANAKPKFENMLFMKNNEFSDCLNIGLPVGSLSTKEIYKCIFKKKLANFQPSEHRRQYAVDKYDNNWEMEHFFVAKDEIPSQVSDFKKVIQNRMQVDFFKDEKVIEALVRDTRFHEDVLRRCKITCDGKRVPFKHMATHYQGKRIKLKIDDTKKEDTSLSIAPRPHPDAVTNAACKVEPSEFKQEVDSAIAGPSSGAPLASSTSTRTVKTSQSSKSLISRESLVRLIECAFESKSQELPVNGRNKLAKECNFAFKQVKGTLFVRQLEVLTEIAKSVGVIFILDSVKRPELIGTCFRIGTQYIMTNNHVIEAIEKVRYTTAAEVTIFIDFNFTKGEVPDPSERRYEAVPLPVVRSPTEELDYAILKMKEPPDELPPCIFKSGVSIMDPNNSRWSLLEGQCLRLIGHPDRQAKLIDPMCPVVTAQEDGLKLYVFTRQWELGDADNEYRHLHDQRRGKYHVTEFFHVSSGSPGILLLNDKKLLVIMHTKGFQMDEVNRSSIEQGILVTEVYKHVEKSIKKVQQDPYSDQNELRNVRLEDIFPSVEGAEPMDINQ